MTLVSEPRLAFANQDPTPRGMPLPVPFRSGVPQAPRPATILIAEDHEDSREALRTLLDAMGYTVRVARNGREAIEAAARETPDLILMDVMMPEIDGFEATRRLRQMPALRGVPIVALTAMEGAHGPVLEAGCTDYVPKPIDVRSFMMRIPRWIDPEGTPAPT